jgi:hypothetical protein
MCVFFLSEAPLVFGNFPLFPRGGILRTGRSQQQTSVTSSSTKEEEEEEEEETQI